MATAVQMPKQGNSVEECLIVDWAVKVGDKVSEGDIVCNIETDKATFEVTAPVSGTFLKTLYNAGDLAPVLVDIAVIGEEGEDVSSFGGGEAAPAAEAPAEKAAPAAEAAPAAANPVAAPAQAAPAASDGGSFVSPRARKLAAELGVNAPALAGTGIQGRVVSADVQLAADSGQRMTPAAIAAAQATGMVGGAGTGVGGRVRQGDLVAAGAAPAASAAALPCTVDMADDTFEVPYIGIRKLIGDRMMQSLTNHAQLTMSASADATAIMAMRKKFKTMAEKQDIPNVTLNDMVAAVVAWTLPKFPELNGVFTKEAGKATFYRNVHLGMAIDTERGLMVPVIKNIQAMSLGQISTTIADYAGQCRKGSIDPDLLSGGTFTITNLGAMGVESFTPVINTPQVAILGVCTITKTPVPDADKGFKFVPKMGLSLTIDHQVVDGAPAARFLKAVADGITNFDVTLALR